MSTRPLNEINHDYLHMLQRNPGLVLLILDELAMCHHNARMNRANADGHATDIGHGVRVVHQYHHTTDVTVKMDYVEVAL
ncbi:hypothetical protein [Burkholderia sp. PU8-34]